MAALRVERGERARDGAVRQGRGKAGSRMAWPACLVPRRACAEGPAAALTLADKSVLGQPARVVMPTLAGVAYKRNAEQLVPRDANLVELALAHLTARERLVLDVVVGVLCKLFHGERPAGRWRQEGRETV